MQTSTNQLFDSIDSQTFGRDGDMYPLEISAQHGKKKKKLFWWSADDTTEIKYKIKKQVFSHIFSTFSFLCTHFYNQILLSTSQKMQTNPHVIHIYFL